MLNTLDGSKLFLRYSVHLLASGRHHVFLGQIQDSHHITSAQDHFIAVPVNETTPKDCRTHSQAVQ